LIKIYQVNQGMTESERLKIAIVGGGLAGALSARVLREKHDVTIYERSKGASEVGAAINVGPNGVKILESLGFDRSKVGSLAVGRTKTWNKEGKIMLDTPLQCQQEYGADWLFNHRVDLRDEFLRLATAEDSSLPGSPSKIQFGAEVVDVDVETGKLWLADGGKIQADLIIGMLQLKPHFTSTLACPWLTL
jgi:salicylate hydroxylase